MRMSYSYSPYQLLHTLLNRCKRLAHVHQIHALLVSTGLLTPDPANPRSRATFFFNGLITAHLHLQNLQNSILLFTHMISLQVCPNGHTFPPVVQAAARYCPSTVTSLHAQAIARGFSSDRVISSCFLKFYSETGELPNAQRVFEEIPSPDVVSFNSMLDALGKNGDPSAAVALFNRMPERDIISWSTVINALGINQLAAEAVTLFGKMVQQAVAPNEATLVSVLSCLGNRNVAPALWVVKQVHGYVVRRAIPLTPFLGTALIDTYGKNSLLRYATKVFDEMPNRIRCTWNALISSLASNGREREAICRFRQMQMERIQPDNITFVGVLTACSRAGLVSLGLMLFESMQEEFGISARVEHCGCVVDMLGKAGLVKEAAEFIGRMPLQPDGSVWGALLGACKMHGEMCLGEEVGKRLVELQPGHSGRYVVLSNLYAEGGRWPEAAHLRQAMARNRVAKVGGFSRMFLDQGNRIPDRNFT